jgi:peptidoglycan/xylan/chitin deacetylase (PgdA/CDA1 family)
VSPSAFRAQLEHLTRHYRVMPLEDLAAAAREAQVPPGAIALTFDDGYEDNLRVASPLLEEFEVPATFFIATAGLDADDYEFWWDALERVLLSQESALPPELRIELGNDLRVFPMRTVEERIEAHWAIYDASVGCSEQERDAVLALLGARAGCSPGWQAAHRRMNRADVVTLAGRNRHRIGAHTSRHLMLPRQPADVQRRDIEESKQQLESLLGVPVRSFAYPYGAFSDETVSLVSQLGFDVAVTCENAPLFAGLDPLKLPRLEVKPTIPDFGAWLAHEVRKTAAPA